VETLKVVGDTSAKPTCIGGFESNRVACHSPLDFDRFAGLSAFLSAGLYDRDEGAKRFPPLLSPTKVMSFASLSLSIGIRYR
jgi:hypothetical protein